MSTSEMNDRNEAPRENKPSGGYRHKPHATLSPLSEDQANIAANS